MARRLTANPEGIKEAARLLDSGAVVAVPTETVYGLAANAYDADACRAIFTIKGRPLMDPLIVHCSGVEQVKASVSAFPEEAEALAERFWPGPLSLVLPKRDCIPPIVSAGLPTVAVRVPGQPVLQRLLATLEYPIAAPSANPFGYISPTSADHVERTLGERITAILDGGPCAYGLESSIVDLRDPKQAALLRPGPIARDAVEEVLGVRLRSAQTPGRESESAPKAAPGLLESHYSPSLPLQLAAPGKLNAESGASSAKTAHVFWQRPAIQPGQAVHNIFWLTENGDDREAARRLFDLLNRLDTQEFEKICIEQAPPDLPLAPAINDRLSRAATG